MGGRRADQARTPREGAALDGACLYRVPPPAWRTSHPTTSPACAPTPSTVAEAPYLIAVGGRERRQDLAAERRYVASLADAGADWWHEYVPPRLDRAEARRRIVAGPVRA